MRPIRSLAYTVTAAALAMLSIGCSSDSSPTAPSVQPSVQPTEASQGLISDLISGVANNLVMTVKRSKPLARDIVVTAQIDARGGRIRVKETGFELTVPKGAVSRMTTFQVKALAGSVLAYEFEPHGTRFAVPLKFKQELKLLDLGSLLMLGFTKPEIGYFSSQTQIDQQSGLAVVSEIAPAIVITDLTGKRMEGNISHFSGYLVSSGRTAVKR